MFLFMCHPLNQCLAGSIEPDTEQDAHDAHIDQEPAEHLRDIAKAGPTGNDVPLEMEFPGQWKDMTEADYPWRIERCRTCHAAQNKTAWDKEDHTARGDTRISCRPAEEQTQRSRHQDIEQLDEQKRRDPRACH